MQVKRILLCVLSTSGLWAGTTPAQKADAKVEEKRVQVQLHEVDDQIEALLDKAKKVREERDAFEDQADGLENKNPEEAKKLEAQANEKHQELVKLLYQLEDLLKKREFRMRELGRPDDEEDSPYQP